MPTLITNHPYIILAIMSILIISYFVSIQPIAKYVSITESENIFTKHPIIILTVIFLILISGLLFSFNNLTNFNTKKVMQKHTELQIQYRKLDAKYQANKDKLRWYKAEEKVYTLDRDLKNLKHLNNKINQIKNQNYQYTNQMDQLNETYWNYQNKMPINQKSIPLTLN